MLLLTLAAAMAQPPQMVVMVPPLMAPPGRLASLTDNVWPGWRDDPYLHEAQEAIEVLVGELKGADVDVTAGTMALLLVSFCTFCVTCVACRCLCRCRRSLYEQRRTRAVRMWADACASLDNQHDGSSCEMGTARLRPSYCNEHGEVVVRSGSSKPRLLQFCTVECCTVERCTVERCTSTHVL